MKLGALWLSALAIASLASAEDTPADVMARNILEWIQGIYRQGVRRTRQENNAYLPPYSTQRPPERPRPFQPASTQQPSIDYSNPSQNEVSYPDYSYTPNQNGYSSTGTGSTGGYSPPQQFGGASPVGGPGQFGGSPVTSTTYLPPSPSPYRPNLGTTGYSPAGTGTSSGYPYPSPGSRPQPGFPTPTTGPTPGQRPGTNPSTPGPSTPGRPQQPEPQPGPGPQPQPGPPPQQPPAPQPGSPSPGPSPPPGPAPTPTPGQPTGGPAPTSPDTGVAPGGGSPPGQPGPGDDDLKHPPHIHEINVECSKTMMTINIEFNRAFNGLIYSKGFYNMPQCRYVTENTGQTKYSFTVNLDSCGTQFINDFEGEAGQAYLENVLVLQNEPGIQEVWDTVRTVRCLWEGNINKALKVSLSVDMLNQELVTFSGDTATAKLDIQVGKGPFAPAASGLVKIGETMTLVVSVEGDPGFDLQVRDCVARDESSTNVYQLTDERGCILKPKLFGAFQKTKDTGNTGASIIAYAFFQAFKFPDVMDLFIECNVELCKTNCDACPEPNQQIEPGRRRRSVTYPIATNYTQKLNGEAVRIGKGFRVVMPEDLVALPGSETPPVPYSEDGEVSVTLAPTSFSGICLSYTGFGAAFTLIMTTLFVSSITAGIFYGKLQRLRLEKIAHNDLVQSS